MIGLIINFSAAWAKFRKTFIIPNIALHLALSEIFRDMI